MKNFHKNKDKINDFGEIHGIHAVIAALKNSKREHKKLIINEYKKESIDKKLLNKVKKIEELTNKDMQRLYGNNNVHQGVILITSNLKQPTIKDVVEKSKNKKNEVVVMLDHITDPNNIGSIMRSCSLFNCKTIIVSKNNSPNITPSLAKTASGALEVTNYIKIANLSRVINEFKKNNFWVFGFDITTKNLNNDLSMPEKCLLVFGSEDKGLRKLTKKYCDKLLSIPTKNNTFFEIDSLNVANSCSIALYEHFKNTIK